MSTVEAQKPKDEPDRLGVIQQQQREIVACLDELLRRRRTKGGDRDDA